MVDLLPSVLFVSSCDENPQNIIKLILGDLPSSQQCEDMNIYNWHINTKYYEADVRLCSKQDRSLSTPEFASSVEVQEWCVKEGFELIELEPLIDEEWDSEQDFIETCGVDRIIQALHAHVWPNLVLKERRDPTTMAGLWHGGFCKSTVTDHESNLSTRMSDDEAGLCLLEYKGENSSRSREEEGDDSFRSRRMLDNIEPTPEELFNDEATDFCDLFSQLPMMKERASSMPSEQRKKFAEDVVLAYWKAIGGDKDEILDFSKYVSIYAGRLCPYCGLAILATSLGNVAN
uniref:Alpha-and gamma-adaptin-binding protein p34 n=1 Tax=Rhodnius prolixus TaxID=13249 RepID=T1HZI5_RHOPR